MLRIAPVLVLLGLGACGDETVTAYVDPGATYRLETLNDVPFAARSTITFPEKGRITGRAPCNSYSGTQSAVYPWFRAAPLVVTRSACPDLAAEARFLEALESARIAEVSGPVLILSNELGLEMVFRAE